MSVIVYFILYYSSKFGTVAFGANYVKAVEDKPLLLVKSCLSVNQIIIAADQLMNSDHKPKTGTV